MRSETRLQYHDLTPRNPIHDYLQQKLETAEGRERVKKTLSAYYCWTKMCPPYFVV
jgi:hypothetical protein